MKSPNGNTIVGESPNTTMPNTAEIVIEPANPRRTPIDELQGLARRIRRRSGNTTTRFAYYEPKEGRYGVTWAEIIHIWLPRMTDAIEAALVIEVVKEAISWAHKRMRKGSNSPRIVYIYGADGKVLREINIKDKDQDPDITIPNGSNISARRRAPLRETACGDCRYVLIVTRAFITKTILAVLRSPQSLATAIQQHKRMKAKRRDMQIREEAAKTVETQRKLKELALTKVRGNYDKSGNRLKRNATYGNANDRVYFETAFENDDGTASELVHIYCARQGSVRQETRRYAEALAEFQDRRKAYRRLMNRGGTAVYILLVPRKDPGKYPYVDWSLFHGDEGFALHGWLFTYKELGYEDGLTASRTNHISGSQV